MSNHLDIGKFYFEYRSVKFKVRFCTLSLPSQKEIHDFSNILRHILKNMKAKSSLKWAISDVFLPDICQLSSRNIGKYVHANEREFYFDQIVANLP